MLRYYVGKNVKKKEDTDFSYLHIIYSIAVIFLINQDFGRSATRHHLVFEAKLVIHKRITANKLF